MKVDYVSNLFVCDNCNKLIKKWEVQQLVKRTYSPGPKNDICSSDIKVRWTKLVDLCPDCMREVEEIYRKIEEDV